MNSRNNGMGIQIKRAVRVSGDKVVHQKGVKQEADV